MPKWRARQVTVSPCFITPLVTPPIARSPDALIEAVCASTDSERSKHSPAGAAITVSSRMEGTSSSHHRRANAGEAAQSGRPDAAATTSGCSRR